MDRADAFLFGLMTGVPPLYGCRFRERSDAHAKRSLKMLHRSVVRSMSMTVMLSLGLTAVAGASVYVPAGLNPGDTYQLAFVTQGTHDATSSDIIAYNDFVQSEAALNSSLTGTDMGVTWNAIVSTPTTAARDNAVVTGPVFLLDGARIADDFADMWDGVLDAPLAVDQFGGSHLFAGLFVWTGSSYDGSQALLPMGTLSGVWVGSIIAHDPTDWIDYAFNQSISEQMPIYALSSELRVPSGSAIPEPTSGLMWLALVGGIWGLSVSRRRRTT